MISRCLLPLLVAVLALPARAAEPIIVIATHPTLANIAAQVGGERIRVTSITLPTGDVHNTQATPSVFALLSDATAFVHSGLDIELWANDAIKGSRNERILPGKPGNIDASVGIKLLQVPTTLTRADGDVHIFGNPHYWTDPLNARIIAQNIEKGLTAVDAAGAATYLDNRKRFEDDINQRLIGWLKKAIPFKNTPIVVYHDSFPYFVRRFGFRTIGYVEPKPRIAPTQAHLIGLIDTMKAGGAKAIIREPFHARSATDFLTEKTGVKVATLTTMVGGVDGSASYQDMIERDLDALIQAIQ